MWGRTNDALHSSVKFRGLVDDGVSGERAKAQRAESAGLWLFMFTWASQERTDGFVTADAAEQFGTRAALARLLRARFGRAPLVHQLGPDGRPPTCACLDGRAWSPDYAYVLHDFLEFNPSRSENDVHRAKKRELRDSELKRRVRDRDRSRCRYCGKLCKHTDRHTDDGLTFDHVDPDVAAGMDNLVVACRGCNNRKNRRTPAAADMVLLPVPSDTDSVTNSATVTELVTESVTETVTKPGIEPDTDRRGALSSDQGPDTDRALRRTSPGRDGAGTAVEVPGSAGTRIGPPDTVRGSRSTSPYRRERTPKAGHPPDRGS